MPGSGWSFGPDLPEQLCCAGQYNLGEDLYVVGGSTPDGGFSVN